MRDFYCSDYHWSAIIAYFWFVGPPSLTYCDLSPDWLTYSKEKRMTPATNNLSYNLLFLQTILSSCQSIKCVPPTLGAYLHSPRGVAWLGTSCAWSWVCEPLPKKMCWSLCSSGKPGHPCVPLPGAREHPHGPTTDNTTVIRCKGTPSWSYNR